MTCRSKIAKIVPSRNLFFISSPEPKGQLTWNLVGSIRSSDTAPVTRQSASPLLTSYRSPGTGHQAPVTKHQSPGTDHWAPSTSHQALSTRHQWLGTWYQVADSRHSLSSDQLFANEPQSSMNKQRLLLHLELDFNTLSDPSIIIEPPRNTWDSHRSTSHKCSNRRGLSKSKQRKRRRYSSLHPPPVLLFFS